MLISPHQKKKKITDYPVVNPHPEKSSRNVSKLLLQSKQPSTFPFIISFVRLFRGFLFREENPFSSLLCLELIVFLRYVQDSVAVACLYRIIFVLGCGGRRLSLLYLPFSCLHPYFRHMHILFDLRRASVSVHASVCAEEKEIRTVPCGHRWALISRQR